MAHDSQQKYDAIQAHFAKGGTVLVATYTQATRYTPKHQEMFKVTPSGLYVQRGKHWDCIDYCALRFSR